jgi:hypothetical protein
VWSIKACGQLGHCKSGQRPCRSRKRINPSRVEGSEISTLSTVYELDRSIISSVSVSNTSSSRGYKSPVPRDMFAVSSRLGKKSPDSNWSADALRDSRNQPPSIQSDKIRRLVADPLISRRATLHAKCITLADALQPTFWPDEDRDEFSFVGVFEPTGSGLKSAMHLTAHAVLVMASIQDLIRMLPGSLQSAVLSNYVLETCLPHIFGPTSLLQRRSRSESFVFPAPRKSIHFCRPACSTSHEVPDLQASSMPSEISKPRRLSANIEKVWDKFLELKRIYRGDLSGIPPGHLDRADVARCMRDLHRQHRRFFCTFSRIVALLGVGRRGCKRRTQASLP